MIETVSNPLTQNLRDANRRLRYWLDILSGGELHSASVAPQQMAGLLSELMQAGQWLRARQSLEKDPELEAELAIYRQHVERLRELMPLIHQQLLSERGRLETERSRIGSTAEWVRGSRQTL